MPICNVRDEPVSGQLPRLVPETQSFHARHAPQGFGDGRINSLDTFGHRCHRFWMIAEDDWARNAPARPSTLPAEVRGEDVGIREEIRGRTRDRDLAVHEHVSPFG